MTVAAGAAAAGGVRTYGVLVLLCLALFLPGLFTIPPIDRDESRFAQATRQMLDSGDFVDIRFQDEPRHRKPVGIYWLQAGSVALFAAERTDIWAYRLPSVVGAVLAVLLTAWAGRRLFDEDTALLGAAMLAGCLLLGVEARHAKTDAVLLACIVAAQAMLARAWLTPERVGRWADPLVFWAALGVGILVKGPIAPLVVAATAAVLAVAARRARWLLALRPGMGLAVVTAIVAPWLVAIALETGGAFFESSVGGDLLGKIFTGQESHGAPPGYYLVTFWATFWPFSLLAALAVPWVWRRRRDPAVTFCLAWIVPTWIVFELVATKLPHYVLPTFPAIALLTAAAVRSAPIALPGEWRRVLPVAAAAAWLAVTLALGPGVAVLPWVLGEPASAGAVVLGFAAPVAGMLALRLLWRQRTAAAVAGLTATALMVYVSAYAFVFPRLDGVWVSRQAAEAVAAVRPCPDTTVAAAGYDEPSLVFLLGTGTRLGDPAAAARHLLDDRCALALVEREQDPAFRSALAAAGAAPEPLATVAGINYSRGRAVALHLYGLAGR
jgi:4-amino-4-deoxy-L-arabinose transferase-like glycosyltransferase